MARPVQPQVQYLGRRAGKRARSLLADCGLLETAVNSRMNRNAWLAVGMG